VLDRRVLDLQHGARADLEDGHRLDGAVRVEHLGHPDLVTEQSEGHGFTFTAVRWVVCHPRPTCDPAPACRASVGWSPGEENTQYTTAAAGGQFPFPPVVL